MYQDWDGKIIPLLLVAFATPIATPIATPKGLIYRVLKREDARIFVSIIRLILETRQGYNITPPW